MKNVNKETIVRTIVLVLALVNNVLTMCGKNPLPFSDEELYLGVSSVVTVCVTLWAWWKNNSFTQNAIEADEFLREKRKNKISE